MLAGRSNEVNSTQISALCSLRLKPVILHIPRFYKTLSLPQVWTLQQQQLVLYCIYGYCTVRVETVLRQVDDVLVCWHWHWLRKDRTRKTDYWAQHVDCIFIFTFPSKMRLATATTDKLRSGFYSACSTAWYINMRAPLSLKLIHHPSCIRLWSVFFFRVATVQFLERLLILFQTLYTINHSSHLHILRQASNTGRVLFERFHDEPVILDILHCAIRGFVFLGWAQMDSNVPYPWQLWEQVPMYRYFLRVLYQWHSPIQLQEWNPYIRISKSAKRPSFLPQAM